MSQYATYPVADIASAYRMPTILERFCNIPLMTIDSRESCFTTKRLRKPIEPAQLPQKLEQ